MKKKRYKTEASIISAILTEEMKRHQACIWEMNDEFKEIAAISLNLSHAVIERFALDAEDELVKELLRVNKIACSFSGLQLIDF